MFPESRTETTEADRIESLRLILERQQHRSVTYFEATEVGESLIAFFELLAEETRDELAILSS
jgi:hypothetical protein